MAQQVYDQEDEKPVTRPNLKKREELPNSPTENLEHIPTMGDQDYEKLNQDRGLAKESGGSDDKPGSPKSLYSAAHPKDQSFIEKWRTRRRLIFVGGALVTLIVGSLVAVFSFLNVFKLDDLMSNIEQRGFIRNNAALNGRSSKYISAYIEARMMDVGDQAHPDLTNADPEKRQNILFRSDRVDTNSPFSDWYKTMRASSFEQNLFETKGIKFTSMINADGKIRPGVIDINGEKSDLPIGNLKDSDILAIQEGKPAALTKYQQYFDTTEFSSNKIARSEIKKVISDNTQFYQVWKRRSLRKAIFNMTGVSSWKFFETTRDKISAKKADIRNRILDNILPDDNVITNVVRCFYGLNKCTPNRDTASPQNRVDSEEGPGVENTDPDNTNTEVPAEENLPDAGVEATALADAGISDALKKILTAANIYTKIINIPSTLDMLSYVNKNISQLVKLVVIARGAQAAGLFQVFETSNDQIKSGQVSGDEVNAFMQNINNPAASAGWSQVIQGNGTPGTTQTGGACSQAAQAEEEHDPVQYQKDYGSYAPLCSDQQIGSAANAQKIQDSYNATIGKVVGPVVSAWSGLKGNIITGTIISVISWLSNLSGKIIDPIVIGTLKAVGLYGDLKSGIAWIFAKTATFLGVSILKGYESSGTIFNWLLQGASYSAESANRQEGAALTTPATEATANQQVALYESTTQQQMSVYDRIASLDNPQSVASKGLIGISNFQAHPGSTIASSLSSMLAGAGKNLVNLVSGHAFAANNNINGYTASKFAGIETYDYPQQCYDLDPITEQPIDGTNALTIFQQYGISVPQNDLTALNSWDAESDSDTFYNTIYDVLKNTPNPDDIAVQIYNCNLLDAAVRGSLGYVYGYTDNNGLNQ